MEPRFPLCLSAADLELIRDALEVLQPDDRDADNRRMGLILAAELALNTQANWPALGAA